MDDIPDGQHAEGEHTEPGSEADPFRDIGLTRLSSLLRHLRERAGLSQQNLAYESGVDQSSISQIESGKVINPRNETLDRFADIFALRIPETTRQQIYERLVEAKERRPTEYKVHPGLVMLDDRLAIFPPRLQRIILELLDRVFDAFEQTQKFFRSE